MLSSHQLLANVIIPDPWHFDGAGRFLTSREAVIAILLERCTHERMVNNDIVTTTSRTVTVSGIIGQMLVWYKSALSEGIEGKPAFS